MDHRPNDFCGRVELTGLFAGGVSKVLDQVFVSRAQQVGKLEVVVRQRDAVEVINEVNQRRVVDRLLADFGVVVDSLEHVFKRRQVCFFDGSEGFVETMANRFLEVLN